MPASGIARACWPGVHALVPLVPLAHLLPLVATSQGRLTWRTLILPAM